MSGVELGSELRKRANEARVVSTESERDASHRDAAELTSHPYGAAARGGDRASSPAAAEVFDRETGIARDRVEDPFEGQGTPSRCWLRRGLDQQNQD